MTIVNVTEDPNNPRKYLVISKPDTAGSSQQFITTTVTVTNRNIISLLEINRGLPGDKGDKGDKGDTGTAGQNGVIFDILPINSGGTNNNTFHQDKIIYYDGTKLASSEIDINNIQTDIISNIYAGTGLSKSDDGSSVTINANIGPGLKLNASNQIEIDDIVITENNFVLSENYIQGILPINKGGTNASFFTTDRLVYFDGQRIKSFGLPTGELVINGMSVNIVAGPGITGGGSLSIPNGSIVIGLNNSDDITIIDDSIYLSEVGSSGIYTKVKTDSKGRVIEGSQLTFTELTGILGFTPWYKDNDGSGSGLDADLLDGNEGYYYRNAANITGTLDSSILSDSPLPPGGYSKPIFNSKGIAIDHENLTFSEIIAALGYTPVNTNGDYISGNLEIGGDLDVGGNITTSDNSITIGDIAYSDTPRSIRFSYGSPEQIASISYYPLSQKLMLSTPAGSGELINKEYADSRYVNVTSQFQQITGVKLFLNTLRVDGQLILRLPLETTLPPLNVGNNYNLVPNLNAELLNSQNQNYYINAWNHTGILYTGIIIPHLENEGTANYIPIFKKLDSNTPMVLDTSLVFQTGSWIYVDGTSLAIGFNKINTDTIHSLLVGTNNNTSGSTSSNIFIAGENNRVTSSNENSAIIGKNNIISGVSSSIVLNSNNIASHDNSIVLGTYGRSWIDNQIVLGGNETYITNTAGELVKESQSQMSLIPLKYNGISENWTTILNFYIPNNRTIQYDAELFFTKTKDTGVASFSIPTGIVKNFSYKEPPDYDTQNKTIIVQPETFTQNGSTIILSAKENYNNSQEREYILNPIISSNNNETSATTVLDIRRKVNLQTLDIKNIDNPITIAPKSDHSTFVKLTKNPETIPYELFSVSPQYRDEHVIRASAFDEFTANTGAPLNYGKNIGFKTECLYYRNSGDPNIYIKYHNHGISNTCPIQAHSNIQYSGFSIYTRTKNNFDFYLLKKNHRIFNKYLEPTNNSQTFRLSLNQNIIGSIGGSGTINVYSTSGSYSSLSARNSSWSSNLHKQLGFTYSVQNLNSFNSNRYNLANINQFNTNVTITKISSNQWPSNFEISGTINPVLGTLDFYLTTLSFAGDNNTPNYPCINDYCPIYTVSKDNLLINNNEYFCLTSIYDNFYYFDSNTLFTQEKQRAFASGQYVKLLSVPDNIENRVLLSNISNQNIILNSGDIVSVSGLSNSIESIDYSVEPPIYYLKNDCQNTGIVIITNLSPISGLGFSNYPSFASATGTYTYTHDSSYNESASTGWINNTTLDIPEAKIKYSTILDGAYYDSNDGIDYITQNTNQFLSNHTKIRTRNTGIPANQSISSIDISDVLLLTSSGFSCIQNSSCQGNASIAYNVSPRFFNVSLDNINLLTDPDSLILLDSSVGTVSNIKIVYDASTQATTLHFPTAITGNLCLRYPTNYQNAGACYVSDIIRPSTTYSTLKDNNFKLTRYSNWLSHPLYCNGSVETTGSLSAFSFTLVQTGLLDQTCSGLLRTNFSEYVLSSGNFKIEPTNISLWRSNGLGSGTVSSIVKVKENIGFKNYNKILTNNTGTYASGLDSLLGYSIIYENVELYLPSAASGSSIVSSSGEYIKLVSDPSLLFSPGDIVGFTGILHYNTNNNINDYETNTWIVDTVGQNYITIQNYNGNIASGNGGTLFKYYNTGIFEVDLTYTKKFHQLEIDAGSDIECLRLYKDPEANRLFNNFNIGYKFNNYSGIFLSSGMHNTFYGDNTDSSSHILTDQYNNNSFSVYFRSGALDLAKNSTGLITLNYPTVYNLEQTANLDEQNNIQYVNIAISSVIKSIEYPENTQVNMFSGSIYNPLDYLSGDNFYIYDFTNTIDNLDVCQPDEEVVTTGTIYKNYFGYNLVGSKHGVWGRNFDGDSISSPIRDLTAFVDTFSSSCGSGYMCVKISGLSFSANIGDSFYVFVDPYICPQTGETLSQRNQTNTAKYLLKASIDGSYKVSNKVKDNIISILIPIPPYFDRVENTYYNAWNTDPYTSITGFIYITGADHTTHQITSFIPDSLQLFRNCSHTDFINNCDDCRLDKDCDYTLSNYNTITLNTRTLSRPEDLEDSILLEKSLPGYSLVSGDIIQWKGLQKRGISIWKEQNSRCDAVLITGYQNLQTDKYPNFNNTFFSIGTSFTLADSIKQFSSSSLPVTGSTNNTGIIYNHNFNTNNFYPFNNNKSIYFSLSGTNKYIVGYNINYIPQTLQTSGTLYASIQNPSSDDWTINESITKNSLPIITKSIDSFNMIGCEILVSGISTERIIPSSYLPESIVFTGVREYSSGIYRFAVQGGTSAPTLRPNIFVSGITSLYSSSGNFIRGNVFQTGSISQYNYPVGPYSDIWYIDLSLDDLTNQGSDFIVQFQDEAWNTTNPIRIKNYQAKPRSITITNTVNKIYYAGNTIPFVFPFDIENLPSSATIRVSGDTQRTPIANYGIGFIQEANKWQGYILSTGLGQTNTTIPIVFGVSGSIYQNDPPTNLAYYSGNILLTGVPFLFSSPMTNISSTGYIFNLGTNSDVLFNYQYPTHVNFNSTANLNIIGIPASIQSVVENSVDVIITNGVTNNPIQSMTPEIYRNNTKKDWMRFSLVANDTSAFLAETRVSHSGVTSVVEDILINIYENINITNIIIPDATIKTNSNWNISFEITDGALDSSAPDIQIIDSPSTYLVTKTYNNESNSWSIDVNGKSNVFNQSYNKPSASNIKIFVKDKTSFTSTIVPLTYVYSPLFTYLNSYYYGVKNKDYYISFDTNNSKQSYDANIDLNINSFTPSNKTQLYNKYNPILNIYEYSYIGEKMLEKWDVRLLVDPVPNLRNISSMNPDSNRSSMSFQIKGIENDRLAVIGFLKTKELEAIDLSSRPLKIINMDPEEESRKELDQGKKWTLSFDVIGGLQDVRFPPTVVLSGLPSICSGYYPDNAVQGSCVSQAQFNNGSQKWQFAFTGSPLCVTGQYDVAVKAFDSTGEDSASLSFFYKPLGLVKPIIKTTGISSEVYPNCSNFYGTVTYSASSRGGDCPYITGITGVKIVGSLPPGITYVDQGAASRPAQPQSSNYFYPTGEYKIIFSGTPVGAFPQDNTYPPVIIEVYDALNQKETKTLTFSVLGVSSMDQNPIGARLYFPSSGYFESIIKEGNETKNEVKDFEQKVYIPYPYSGSFECRSNLFDNNCTIISSGIYTKIDNDQLSINFGPKIDGEEPQSSNIYVAFDYRYHGYNSGINDLYQLTNIQAEEEYIDPLTSDVLLVYSGILKHESRPSAFSSVGPPDTGLMKYFIVEAEKVGMFGKMLLNSIPPATTGCATCVLGDGKIESGKLKNKMRPSMIAAISGSYYADISGNDEQQNNFGGSLPSMNLMSGLSLSGLPWINEGNGEIHTFCFNNCYETGINLISGIIIPMPSVDVIDIPSYSYNGFSAALQSRCAFGIGNAIKDTIIYVGDNEQNRPNYRSLDFVYIIQSGIGSDNTTVVQNGTVTTPNNEVPTVGGTFSLQNQIVQTGAIYRAYLKRESDPFPTFNINSYGFIDREYYWHQIAHTDDTPTQVEIEANENMFSRPLPVFLPSGFKAFSGEPFDFRFDIIGGDHISTSGDNNPKLSGEVVIYDTLEKSYITNDNDYNINFEILSNHTRDNDQQNGWRAKITGIIENITGSYIDRYKIKIYTEQTGVGIPFNKNSTTYIPLTIMKRQELYLPTIQSGSNTLTGVAVSYGNPVSFSLGIIGGNRSGHPHDPVSVPLVEINNSICGITNGLVHSNLTNTWTGTITTSIYANQAINSYNQYTYQITDGFSFNTGLFYVKVI